MEAAAALRCAVMSKIWRGRGHGGPGDPSWPWVTASMAKLSEIWRKRRADLARERTQNFYKAQSKKRGLSV